MCVCVCLQETFDHSPRVLRLTILDFFIASILFKRCDFQQGYPYIIRHVWVEGGRKRQID